MNLARKGFTVVELLVVVIVIGILASITIVAYNGAQDRAEYARAKTDMKHINDALIIYKSQNGTYPSTGGAWTYQYNIGSATPNSTFLAALVPTYLDKMPIGKANTSYYWYSYFYRSDNGTDYKLLRCIYKDAFLNGALPAVEKGDNPLLDTPGNRSTACWGYWSTGGATY